MFFKKLFTKDHRFYLQKGEKYFAEERYADARNAFLEALQQVKNDVSTETEINQKLSVAGDRLGQLNLTEAEYALKIGDYSKAREHLHLVAELAHDPAIKRKSEDLMGSIPSLIASVESSPAHHNCSGCSTESADTSVDLHASADHLPAHERFELLVQPLPGDLPARYAALGTTFAEGYLLVHDGEEKAGVTIFQKLLRDQESDILLYEIALVSYRTGSVEQSEKLLRRAITVNETNPLCYLALVHLLTDTGRLAESIPLLQTMIDRKLLIEQATVFLGDIYQKLGDKQKAMEIYSHALTYPSSVKAAAERLVAMLQVEGRLEEAAFLAKRHLKGCC